MIGPHRSDLIGRDAETGVAVAALDVDRPGVVVTGEAGAGKTALVLAALQGRHVLTGQCFRSLAWTPGIPLEQAIGRPIPPGDIDWAAQAVATACRGAVLHLDDLQWADTLTLEVLGLLPASVQLAITVRSGDPGEAAALASVADRMLVRIEVEPLGLDDAVTLALRHTPRLRPTEARRLAERCGGNPLLIEELGAEPEPTAGLRRSVLGRLRRLGEPAWQGFAMLAVAGEPLAPEWLPDLASLRAAGLIVDSPDARVQPRHPLLAEAVAQDLADGAQTRRRVVELALADRAEAAGQLPLAARCCAAAGDRARATDLALRAAATTERQGERAALLYLAAASATSPEQAATLTVQAVEELVVSGDYDQAARLIDVADEVDDAHWWGLVGRVRWQQGDDDAAIAAYERGLAVVTPGTADAVLLAAEQARTVLLALGEHQRGHALAVAALAMAQEVDAELPRALAVLGTTEHFIDLERECLAHLEEAVERARQDGDVMVEFTTANNLISSYEGYTETRRAIEFARTMAARAEVLHMRRWQRQMSAMAFNSLMHLGDYEELLAEIPALLADAGDRRTREQLELTLALAQTDVGRGDETIERLNASIPRAIDDYYSKGSLLYGRAEAHLWTGNPAAGLADALQALTFTSAGPRQLFPLLTIAHARLRLGEPVSADSWPDGDVLRITAGATPELEGLVALSGDDRASASALFAEAAHKWVGHRRGELRCRWLAADCAADDALAREQLLALEQELSELGWQPLLGQVRRSLRARGVRSAAPRGKAGELTAREREVLDLVAQGLSTDAVAKRLGLSPATVAAQISSARARLGATTRWQASSAG